MKKRILLIALMIAMLVCVFVISASAATPDNSREKVKLDDGQELAIWATDGSGLIWYIQGTDESGANVYACVSNLEQDTTLSTYIKYSNVWKNDSTGYYQLNQHGIKIYEKGANSDGSDKEYAIDTIVVANFRYSEEKPLVLPGHSKPLNSFEKTFQGKSNLEYVFMPTQLIHLKTLTFQNCTKLKACDLTNTQLRQMDSNVFQNISTLTTIGTIPDTFVAANGCFENMTGLTSINLPSGTILGSQAFKGCTNLVTIEGLDAVLKNMGDNQKPIPADVFKNCKALVADIVIYEGTTSIGNSAFYNCQNITSITFPTTLTTIQGSTNNNDDGAFENCTSLTAITIPKSVKDVYGNTFFGCSALETVIFEDRLMEDGTYNPLTFYGWAPFQKCTALKKVVLPEGLTSLVNGMFASCSSLQSVTLPSSITGITGDNQFSYTALTEVIGLENTKITSIPHSMFRGVKTWQPDMIVLPNTVTTIATYGFADVGMKAIKLGNGVTTINNEAFTACLKLEAIYIPSSVTTLTLNNAMKDVSTRLIFTTATSASGLTISSSVGVSKTDSNVITYEQYLEGKDTTYATGTWIITGINVCDTFYNGIHELDPEQSNACAGICAKCAELSLSANPVHVEKVVITFADLTKIGTKVTTCENANCPYHESEEIPAVFTYVGVSADMATHQFVTVGYLINQDSLNTYMSTLADGVAFSYGFVATATAADTAINGTPISAETGAVTASNMVQINLSAQENIEKCSAFDFKMAGDFTLEKYLNANLGIALYTMTRTTSAGVDTYTVKYLGESGESATLTSFTFAEKITQGE